MADPYGWSTSSLWNPVAKLRQNQLTADEQYAIDMFARASEFGAKNSPAYKSIAKKTMKQLNAVREIGMDPWDMQSPVKEQAFPSDSEQAKALHRMGVAGFYTKQARQDPVIGYNGAPTAGTVLHERTHAYQHEADPSGILTLLASPPGFIKKMAPDFYYWNLDPAENDARATGNQAAKAVKNGQWLNDNIGTYISLADLLRALREY